MGYPAGLALANVARLLFCIMMILTFPLSFLVCREMNILILLSMHKMYYTYEMHRFNIFLPFYELLLDTCRRKPHQQVMYNDGGGGAGIDVMEEAGPLSLLQRRDSSQNGFGTGNIVSSGPNEEWFGQMNGVTGQITEPLLSDKNHEQIFIGGEFGKIINPSPLSSRSGDWSSAETTVSPVPIPTWIITNGNGRQLVFFWHTALTFTIWLVATICAIRSHLLCHVLDLGEAFTGTLLAFVLPSMISFKLKGYSHLSLAISLVGGGVGLLGTVFSFIKLFKI